MYFKNYLDKISKTIGLAESVKNTSDTIYEQIIKHFDYRSELTGLLLGNVQSGKTAQMFGLISKLADNDFKLFIILTTDNVQLQTQTFGRALTDMNVMEILSETDDLRLRKSDFSKPIVIILKKNTRVLRKWRGNLAASSFCDGRPIVVLDDEADAASLNTSVNSNSISQINRHLAAIKKLSTSSIYLQITATPQAVLLQSQQSNFKPTFVHYFEPGSTYIGGDFIYSNPKSFCIEFVPPNELDNIRAYSDDLHLGLISALKTFMVICADFKIKGEINCNFLVHSSVRIQDHDTFGDTIGQILNSFLHSDLDKNSFKKLFKPTWSKLHSTQPDISSFDDIEMILHDLLNRMDFNILIFNSRNKLTNQHEKGFNIIVGGNTLGRGVTFPHLQVVYYIRRSRTPQADTFWQHSRIFGYDRVKGLIRVFISETLHEIFIELNNSNRILIQQIKKEGLDGVQLIYPSNIRPTRNNVIDNDLVNIIVGGVNFFSKNPIQSNPSTIDTIIKDYDEQRFHSVQGDLIVNLLENFDDIDSSDWNKKYIYCIKALREKRPLQQFALIVRRDRDISKDTGTLLSERDREIGDNLKSYVTLTMYRVKGDIPKGWKGHPFWIPNIKFPDGINFYDMNE